MSFAITWSNVNNENEACAQWQVSESESSSQMFAERFHSMWEIFSIELSSVRQLIPNQFQRIASDYHREQYSANRKCK